MAKEKLLVIPLGGLGEIGKNMTVFQYGEDIIVLDAGLSFPDDDMPVFCDIEIDNLEEVAKGMSDMQRATLWADVNNCLLDELTELGGFVRSYGDENYVACLSRQALDVLKHNNFSFLEKIRAIHTVNRIPVTISMAVFCLLTK